MFWMWMRSRRVYRGVDGLCYIAISLNKAKQPGEAWVAMDVVAVRRRWLWSRNPRHLLFLALY